MLFARLKYNIRLMAAALAVIPVMAALSSCDDLSDLTPDESQPAEHTTLRIGLTVAAPSSLPGSRDVTHPGFEAPGYEQGSLLENHIDLAGNRLRIYLFDSDGMFIAWYHPTRYSVLAGTDFWRYTLEGEVPTLLASHSDFKVMVAANYETYPDETGSTLETAATTLRDAVNADWSRFNAFGSFSLSVDERRLIPFYGLKSFSGVVFPAGGTIDLGDITMLRAMAKVELTVDLSSLPEGVGIQGDPVITGYNQSGFCAPDIWYGQGDDWTTDYVAGLHMPSGDGNEPDAATRSVPMLRADDDPSGVSVRWIAYLPEYRNRGVGDACSSIRFRLTTQTDDDRPYVIYFANYDSEGRTDNSDAVRLDIRRNDIYRFSVDASLTELLFALTVDPWIPGGKAEIEI